MADRSKTNGVGYKRPPDHTKFRPGQSGNPKGRPKQHRNLATDLREELAQLISIREDGKARRVTKQRAFVKGLIQRAVNGDARAVNSLVALCARTFLTTDDVVEQAPAADQDLVEDFIRREAERIAASQRAHKDKGPQKCN
jgi:hypothetical protein